ncbi:hypothetical protein LTR62_008643 [Meristemomyces frigidus]|uniref:Sulfhydryl oxidase n=1 Tax=Meristemomyces frigidus TaxID=1508187 RepID=A0AAN7YN63_9PEZI|nr:hypothetical protein LTR62_008643 [Meristemomyces frigidus]
MPQGPSRRYLFALLAICAIFALFFLSSFHDRPTTAKTSATFTKDATASSLAADHVALASAPLPSTVIMPKLGNATAKAELGRSAWHLFHTIMSRFPDTPTADEQSALKSYIHLFVRLYPCGECAEHFRQIVEKFPPQVGSRSSAAVWACVAHNEVNKSLGKEVFDCSKIGEFYDCGCAEDEEAEDLAQDEKDGVRSTNSSGKPEMSQESKEKLASNGREFNIEAVTGDGPLKVD